MNIICQKRQKINKNKQIIFRCINKECDLYGQIIDDICENCQFNKNKNKNKINFNIWDVECGPCSQRIKENGDTAFCLFSNHDVDLLGCKRCISEQHQHGLIPEQIIRDYNNISNTQDEKKFPELLTQANNYRLAVTRWIKAGRPKRTDEEIKDIYDNICSKCDWYDIKTSRCKGCGCRVVPKGLALVNKLRMATEHCPKQLF